MISDRRFASVLGDNSFCVVKSVVFDVVLCFSTLGVGNGFSRGVVGLCMAVLGADLGGGLGNFGGASSLGERGEVGVVSEDVGVEVLGDEPVDDC